MKWEVSLSQNDDELCSLIPWLAYADLLLPRMTFFVACPSCFFFSSTTKFWKSMIDVVLIHIDRTFAIRIPKSLSKRWESSWSFTKEDYVTYCIIGSWIHPSDAYRRNSIMIGTHRAFAGIPYEEFHEYSCCTANNSWGKKSSPSSLEISPVDGTNDSVKHCAISVYPYRPSPFFFGYQHDEMVSYVWMGGVPSSLSPLPSLLFRLKLLGDDENRFPFRIPIGLLLILLRRRMFLMMTFWFLKICLDDFITSILKAFCQ